MGTVLKSESGQSEITFLDAGKYCIMVCVKLFIYRYTHIYMLFVVISWAT